MFKVESNKVIVVDGQLRELAQRTDGRWDRKDLKWRPGKWSVWHLPTRSTDDLVKAAAAGYMPTYNIPKWGKQST